MARQLMGSGGHRPIIEIDKKELSNLINDLERLLPPKRGTKTIVRQAMRKAMQPMLSKLKELVPKDTGQLRKSLALINGKGRRDSFPSVYVGPRVKGAYADMQKSGFYMYFLEYGTATITPNRYFKRAKDSTENKVYGSIIPSLRSIIEKRFKKKGLK